MESVSIIENATGDRHERRWLDIRVRLIGAYHDGHIELTYKNVHSYSLGAPAKTGHGDWLTDEVRLADDGLAHHEVVFALGGRWSITCEDINYEWIP